MEVSMNLFVACVIGTGIGVFVARRRAFWLRVVSVGIFLGIGFAIVERDPTYLIGAAIFGLIFLLGGRRSPNHSPHTPA
jgi:hypothetical protein